MFSVNGVLEIDESRGIIYFTPTEGEMKGEIFLRIYRLPSPVPLNRQIEVCHLSGVNYEMAEANAGVDYEAPKHKHKKETKNKKKDDKA